jgi:hypothetical protein
MTIEDEDINPEWEINEHSRNYRFFFDFALKAIGLYFAIIYGMLSIIGRDPSPNREVLKFLFAFSFGMSVILFCSFTIGGWLWRRATKKIKPIAKKKMKYAPDFALLYWLLWLYGTAILAVGIALLILLNRLV